VSSWCGGMTGKYCKPEGRIGEGRIGTLLTSWNNCEPGSLKGQMGIANLPRDLRYGDPTVCD
jgi:hypothetical protein